MNKDKLSKELQKLVKRANQRILRLERLTGETETFAVKELIDTLSINGVDGLTESGSRVKFSKYQTVMQMLAIQRAVKNFLSSEVSTTRGVKKYTKNLGIPNISFSYASTVYQSDQWEFITEYVPKSEFWGDWSNYVVSEGRMGQKNMG